jgi:hypothetical protein
VRTNNVYLLLCILFQNEARQLNHKEVIEEDKRQKLPSNWEARKRRADWMLQEEEERTAAAEQVSLCYYCCVVFMSFLCYLYYHKKIIVCLRVKTMIE